MQPGIEVVAKARKKGEGNEKEGERRDCCGASSLAGVLPEGAAERDRGGQGGASEPRSEAAREREVAGREPRSSERAGKREAGPDRRDFTPFRSEGRVGEVGG
jgi:hypothetical protein